MQEDALRQAREDLAAREREIEPDELEDEPASLSDKILEAHRRASGQSPEPYRHAQSEPSPYISDAARRMHADAERRRRGLGPEEQAYDPVRQAQMIVDADQKARKA